MTLKELIVRYRKEHNLSQRQFAVACDLSNGYISMIEREVNPQTGEKIVPTLIALKKLATGMNISLADLLVQVDDMPVDIMAEIKSAPKIESGLNNLDDEIASLILRLSPEKKHEAVNYLRFLAESPDS